MTSAFLCVRGFSRNWDFSQIFSLHISKISPEDKKWAGGEGVGNAQRPVFRVIEYKKTGVCSARSRSAAKPYLFVDKISIIAFNIAIVFDELHTIEFICILDKSQLFFAVVLIGSNSPSPAASQPVCPASLSLTQSFFSFGQIVPANSS